jgi:putative SOS response-associated peptidase YedK
MCYSAQVEASFKKLQRMYPSDIDFESFESLFGQRLVDDKIKIARAVELNFTDPQTAVEKRIKELIDAHYAATESKVQQEIFRQKKRLADAERTLREKATKKALNEQRIATNKIASDVNRLKEFKRTTLEDRDMRIYPFEYVPIIVNEGAGNRIIAARYHCRPAGKPSSYDKRFDGLYTARRDSLQNFWKDQFGKCHAIMVISSFWENVKLHNYEHRSLKPEEVEKNLVLHFNPKPAVAMSVACLWSRWNSPGERSLTSFAAISDAPPPEIAAAGHDRVVIALKDTNVATWLLPDEQDAAALFKLLDDRQQIYFEHLRAA